MKGCNYMGFDDKKPNGKRCNEPVIRDGKCEKHKVERRQNFGRRSYESCDSPTSCGNGMCHTKTDGKTVTTVHHTMCPDYGPGWA
jgi:hypothetical protein